MGKRTCSRDDCDEPHRAKGLCKKHYREARAERLARQQCKVDGCENPQGETGGYCLVCYQRHLEYGDPAVGPPRRKRRKASEPSTGSRSRYHVNHVMVRKARGPAWQQACKHCGKPAADWATIHGEPGDSPDHYIPLCRRCHLIYDGAPARLPDNRGSKRSPESRRRISEALLNRSPEAKAITRDKQSRAATLREARKREKESHHG